MHGPGSGGAPFSETSSTVKSTEPVLLLGYRTDEVVLAALGPIKSEATIYTTGEFDLNKRKVVRRSLGCHVKGAALPVPDPNCNDSIVAGICKRFAVHVPEPEPALMKEMHLFVVDFCRKNLVPLPFDTDFSFEHWIEIAPYPKWRKDELLDVYNKIEDVQDERNFIVKSFIKDEEYTEYKYPRIINARDDRAKCIFGPIFKNIEKEVFRLEHFIKKIPVADRPKYLLEMLGELGIKETGDMTAYESSFRRVVMENIELPMYRYMLQYCPIFPLFEELFTKFIMGLNTCTFKHIKVMIEAVRMSGEMNTSLGNGFSTLMLILFAAKKYNIRNVSVAVEGDDNIKTQGTLDPAKGPVPATFYNRLGFNMKLEVHDELATASFCGIVSDPKELINITDPRKVMASFGWTTNKYARCGMKVITKLLRCKGLSAAHSYPGCPIIKNLAKYALRVTRSYDVRDFIKNKLYDGVWQREKMMSFLEKPVPDIEPGIETRLLVERLYGISVVYQYAIEAYLDSLDTLQPLDYCLITDIMPEVWKHYYTNYSTDLNIKNHRVEDSQWWFARSGRRPDW
jgi:hypothetical protein